MSEPVFVLAPPRSYTSVVCAMLGQHPSLCGLPEVNLHVFARMEDWCRLFQDTRAFVSHGLVRAVGELVFGAQSEATVALAGGWIRARRRETTGRVFQELASHASGRGFVEKSPSTVLHPSFLARALDAFPNARFLHLLRHPRTTCDSILGAPEILGAINAFSQVIDLGTCRFVTDPERLWYETHRNVLAFLEPLPQRQKMRIRGEDLMSDVERHLREICAWAEVPFDESALEEMRHPERSPFSRLGPPGATWGNDTKFLGNPVLRPEVSRRPTSLEGPLPWRKDGSGFAADAKALAVSLGYA